MFRCHGRPQVALEQKIAGIISDVDQDKRTEFRSLISQLHSRLPPRQKPEAKVKVPDETSVDFNKLLENLASAKIVANIQATDVLTDVIFKIEEFVLRAVTVVRKHGAELQKKNTSKAYDYRATAAFHLFHTGKLLVELPDDAPCLRMVNYLGDAYYLTRWCVGKVRRCSFRRNFVVGFCVP